jgi:hypothetical protein
MLVSPNFCAACGQGLRQEDKFCSGCGAPVPQPPFESPDTMARSALGGEAIANQSVQRGVSLPPAAEAQQSAEVRQREVRQREEKTDAPIAFTSTPTAYDYVAPEVVQPPRRRSRPPVLEILVIVLLLVGAGAAVWMLRSSLPARRAAAPSNIDVTLSPSTARVAMGHAFDFAASVSGTDDVEVDWTVQEGDEGGRVVPRGAKAVGGKVSSLAVYIAPDSPGTYHLLATSKANPQKSALAEITVKAGKSR